MTPSRLVFCISIPAILALWLGCKKDDPMDEAKRLLSEDPDKAIPLLQEQYNKDPDNYETIVGLAHAYKTKKSPSWERAAAWYRKALAHQKGQEKNEQKVLRDELLSAISKQIEAGRSAMEAKDLVGLLREANGLERDLARNNIVAGRELFEAAKARFDAFVKAEKYTEAIDEVEKLDEIYIDQSSKQPLLDQLPELEGKEFEKLALGTFRTKFMPKLVEEGSYSADQQAFLFSASGKTTVGEEGAPDPASEGFAKTLEETTCGPKAAIPRLAAILDPITTEILGRKLSDVEVKKFHGFATRNRKTRWEGEAFDPEKKYEPGQVFELVCEDSLSLQILIGGLRVMHMTEKK